MTEHREDLTLLCLNRLSDRRVVFPFTVISGNDFQRFGYKQSDNYCYTCVR